MSNVLNVLLSAVKAGGQAAKSVVPSSGIIPKEGRGNFVTAGDLASEKTVAKIVKINAIASFFEKLNCSYTLYYYYIICRYGI